ncbi:hypothetical protein PV963_42115 [Streptomyces coeruleorubidus]|uniref:VOC family protein n=1 Tax=Streptomyces coeruleorubidus TaxID=116188 RepID=UPI00237F9521|nr:VOC family protein [Streptomyces coeruleorubidus]WDV56467.1 hypothetical protein PV963_42115 [Streptomyces coeruleorubidus]
MKPCRPSGPEGTAGWILHFGVEDIDGAVGAAKSLGGTVVSGPAEVAGVGRVALLKDPADVTFALVQFV